MGRSYNKIFGIGLSRTGTSSLNQYLCDLGFHSIHYPRKPFSNRFPYDAATDITVSFQFAQLDLLYPNSKFIMTVREKEDWLNSMEKYMDRPHKKIINGWPAAVRNAFYGSFEFDRLIYGEAYDRHMNSVKKHFKQKPWNLIYINILGGESPERLCKFLNVEYKGNTFPHKNKLR